MHHNVIIYILEISGLFCIYFLIGLSLYIFFSSIFLYIYFLIYKACVYIIIDIIMESVHIQDCFIVLYNWNPLYSESLFFFRTLVLGYALGWVGVPV